ncbi:MAG TPA: acyltransferase [Opitutaceae bacterium]|nr:acyltransferase [Opitutaceae bacterium]
MADQPDRLESIDALRGMAFLGVLLVHAGQGTPEFAWRDLTATGAFGVSLFFIASAFTLLTSHHRRRSGETLPTLAFFIRRVFRIVPLFWAGIVFYYLIHGTWNRGWAEGPLGWLHFGSTALLLHGWHPDTVNSVVPGGWSIAAEFGFYALAPVLFVALGNGRRALIAYLAAVVLAAASNALLIDSTLIARLFPSVPDWRRDSFLFLWLPFHLPTFLLGFLAYYFLPHYRRLGSRTKRICLATVCVAVAGCAAGLPLRVNDFLLPVLLAAFVVAVIAEPAALLVNRWTCTLGAMSFSAYITHFAALKIIQKFLGGQLPAISPGLSFGLLFFATLALTALSSAVTYRWIEQPGIALGRKLLQEIRKRSDVPTPAHVQTSRTAR